MFSCINYTSIFFKKSCLKKNLFCVVILEHSRIYICCSTIQNICCSSNVPISSCESSSSGSTHVLWGCIGCNHKDLEVSMLEWFLGGTSQIFSCLVDISFIAKASVQWWESGWETWLGKWPLLSHFPFTTWTSISLRLDFFICKIIYLGWQDCYKNQMRSVKMLWQINKTKCRCYITFEWPCKS